jgi:hypothetical protein
LDNKPAQKPESNARKTLPGEQALREFMERRLDVYLCGNDGVAMAAVDTIAKGLNLNSYRFQCSSATKEWELRGHFDKEGNYHPTLFSKAFSTGGVFCIHRVERAPDDLQSWIKSCFDGRMVVGNRDLKRHMDFVLVLTSSVGARQLWSGNIDSAFLDHFSYL